MPHSLPPDDDPSAGDDASGDDVDPSGSAADGTPVPGSVTTRRRYLAITAGVALSGPLAGCTSVGSDSSTTDCETPDSTSATPDGPETTPAGVGTDEDGDERSDDETPDAESEPVDDDPEPTDDDASSVDELPLFDAHTHVIPTKARGRDALSAADLVAWMDGAGVDRAVVLPFDSPEGYPVQAPSWWVLEEIEAYPDRLVPFCSIDPRTLVYEDEIVEELLEGFLERGARGFGELKVGMPIDDARLDPLYELCADYGLPILFHTDRQSLTDEVGLPRLESVLASYPTVDFVAHAHGWWAHMAADVTAADLGRVPEGPIHSPGRIWDLFDAYDNIYGDISTLGGWNALTRDPAVGQTFLETYHDRLVFGSDYLFPGQDVPHLALFDRFDLELEAWANIRHRTLEGLLR